MRPITADRSCKSLCTEKEPRGNIANTRGWKGMSPASIHPLGQVVAALERHCHLIRGHALELGEILAFSHSKNLMPSFVYASRPKWQYAAVSWYLGSRSAKDCAMAPGRQSNSILITLVMSSAVSAPCSVP